MNRKLIFIFLVIFSLSTVYAQRNNRLDTDGDGVIDKRDVDDDNDGIYDRYENRVRKIQLKNWVNRTNVQVSKNNIFFTRGDNGWNNSVNSMPFSSFGFINNYNVSFNAKVSTKVIVGFGINENGNNEIDVDFGFMFDKGKVSVYKDGIQTTSKLFYRFNDDFSIIYENSKLKFFKNNSLLKEFNVDSGISFYLDTSFKGENRNYRKANFSNFLIYSSFGNRDIDGDGILNSKDLDSDGDGCSDVIEAGFEDPDNDGILGLGIPQVDKNGKVISCQNNYNQNYNSNNDDDYNDDDDDDDDENYGNYGNHNNNHKGHSRKWKKKCDGYENVNDDFLDPTTQTCSSEVFGITINTVELPNTSFDIVFTDTTLSNLLSGTSDSEVFVDLGVDNGDDKIILINVSGTSKNAALNLRITKSLDNYVIEVFQNGIWLLLSPEYYRIQNSTISFVNLSQQKVNPFLLNLVNGVEYNRLEPLIIEIDDLINVEGGSLEINGPNNFTITIDPNLQGNNFIWDGTQSQSGTYTFKVQLQGKFFNGQFLIL